MKYRDDSMETRSVRSLRKMRNSSIIIDDIGEDLIQNILCRLPASSFASAACVSRSWNSICNRILFSALKLSSAISFNPSLEDAVNEVVNKVLAKPTRPHFVLASIGPSFNLGQAQQLINGKFGSEAPIIVNVSEGIIGRDAQTDEFKEVQWEVTEEEDLAEASPNQNVNRGIILTVGFLPGLKAHIVPLLLPKKDLGRLLIDEFVISIREYTSYISGNASPSGIMLFSDRATDIKPLLQKLDHAFSLDTVIVGDGGSQFSYRSDDGNGDTTKVPAVALLFVNESWKPPGIGETKFHVMMSTGLSPLGSTYKAASVRCHKTSTWLTANRDTLHEHLDGQSLLDEIYDELGDRIQFPVFYIGVTKRRRCSVGREKARQITFHEFHEVMGGNEEYLFVNSDGIKTGDLFRFYISDSKAALSSCNEVSDKLKHLKQDCSVTNDKKREVFGGIIFSCCGRGDSFFGRRGVDSSPFLDNFPGVPFGGTYCNGEIGRGNMSFYRQGNEEGEDARCSLHAFSAVYLIISYTPPPQSFKIMSNEPGCSSSKRRVLDLES